MRWVMTVLLTAVISLAARAEDPFKNPGSVLLGPANIDLAMGSQALKAGNYDEGIERTLVGLNDKMISDADRASGLSNLCAGYAAKQLPDTAVRYCTQSLAIDDQNWHAYSNRSYAYWIMGRYSEAQQDLDIASDLNPRARQVAKIRGMLNLVQLRPSVFMEDLQ